MSDHTIACSRKLNKIIHIKNMNWQKTMQGFLKINVDNINNELLKAD